MKPATTEDVLDLMDAHLIAAALGAAMELGLFWLLAEGPLDAAGVAQALGIPVNRCQYWLQLLGSVGDKVDNPSCFFVGQVFFDEFGSASGIDKMIKTDPRDIHLFKQFE